jgi:hypothetical protein
MKRFWRWLAIKLLVHSCVRKAPEWREDRKAFLLCTRCIKLTLVGQAPGTCYSLGGRRGIVLLGEGIQYLVSRTVLRGVGSFFKADGVMQVRSSPGVSWLWMLQIGAVDGR